MFANVGGETDRAIALLTESFTWWERSSDIYGYAIARNLLGGVRVSQGQWDEAAALFGDEPYRIALEVALALYRFASGHAEARGIILADTKFELGVAPDGAVVLADEALTPDSSRFWPASEYEPGHAQPSFDKQFVRDWLERAGWNKEPPGPELPDDLVAGTRARYIEAFERLTEISFDAYLANPEVVL